MLKHVLLGNSFRCYILLRSILEWPVPTSLSELPLSMSDIRLHSIVQMWSTQILYIGPIVVSCLYRCSLDLTRMIYVVVKPVFKKKRRRRVSLERSFPTGRGYQGWMHRVSLCLWNIQWWFVLRYDMKLTSTSSRVDIWNFPMKISDHL